MKTRRMHYEDIERPLIGLTPAQLVVGSLLHKEHLPVPGELLDWNMHQEFEISILLDGERECHTEEAHLDMRPGDVRLHPGWEPHGWRARTAECRYVGIFFLPEFLGDEAFDGRPWFSLFAVPFSERPRVTSEEMRQQVLVLGHQLARELTAQMPGWTCAVRLDVLKLLFVLQREWHSRSTVDSYPRVGALSRVMPAVELVRANLGRRIPLAEAAAACSLSQAHFRLIFSEAMGQTFSKFALRSRLGYAARLLVSTDRTVDSIADATGFTDSSHLNLHFRKVYGCTTSHYRSSPRHQQPIGRPGSRRDQRLSLERASSRRGSVRVGT